MVHISTASQTVSHAAFGAAVPTLQGEEATALRHALMESRQRWRQFGAIASDLAFETDTVGNLTFLAPDSVLGRSAASLLGGRAASLLATPDGPDPFSATVPLHRRHVWLRRADGATACMALTTCPMQDEAGRFRGVRGVGVNVTDEERSAATTAAALRRADVLDHILTQMRQEVLAPRMMRSMLESITRALGCAGAAVVDLIATDPPHTLHEVAPPPPAMLAKVYPALADGSDALQTWDLADGGRVLACPCSTRFGDRAAMLAWREPGGRDWDADDHVLAGSVGGIIRIVLEHEAIQRELARQARTDPLTGLLNRRAFIEEASRRLDRLATDGIPGTLMFLDLDQFKALNDLAGHDAGDSALKLVAALLQHTFRPTDLIARLGGDEFAVWLDSTDSLTAAERAEDLCRGTPQELGHLTPPGGDPVGMSIGIATREPNSDETLEQLIQRADQAMYDVKRNGRRHWRVSHGVLAQ